MNSRTLSPSVRIGLSFLATAALALVLGAGTSIAQDRFDHESHEGLFPDCRTCHDPGGRGLYIVTPNDCAKCHNDDDMGKVEWMEPVRSAPLVRFDHSEHPYAINDPDEDLECATCHSPGGDAGAMEIVLPTPGVCLDCHEGASEPHFAPGTVDCTTCHMPLTEAVGVSTERIEGFPQPETHASPDFAWEHGGLAGESPDACAVCHARQSCERCHANGDDVAAIAALGEDDRIGSLVAGREGSWPTPPDHENESWWFEHGSAADESPVRCATCHDANSCTGCHERGFARLQVLPAKAKLGMPVLPLRPLNHTPNFAREHGPLALSNDCSVCHDQDTFCADCHQGQMGGGYHPQNFVLQHAASAAGPDPACADCHSTEVFCRSCHIERGLSPTNQSRANGYHDSEPLWLANHGAAARQGLDECASCHQQHDCLRCHSARSGWRINPHGPDFDPRTISDANEAMCLGCHPQSFLR